MPHFGIPIINRTRGHRATMRLEWNHSDPISLTVENESWPTDGLDDRVKMITRVTDARITHTPGSKHVVLLLPAMLHQREEDIHTFGIVVAKAILGVLENPIKAVTDAHAKFVLGVQSDAELQAVPA